MEWLQQLVQDNDVNAGVQKHGSAARPKGLQAPNEEISLRYEDQSQRML